MNYEGWRRVRLGDLVDISHGFAFKGSDFTDEPTGDVLVTPGNFRIGGGWQDGKRKYHRSAVDPAYVLAPGDLVVSMTDLSKQGDTLGYPALVPSVPGLRFLHNQRIGRVRVREDEDLSAHFLYYLLRTREYRNEVLSTATGSTVRHTSPKRIYNYECLLPPLPEQHAIAEVLGALDDKIEVNERMNATLDEMARALFKSWFVDFDPVRAKAEGRQPSHMDAATAALFPASFEDSPLGPIPAGWRVSTVGEVVSVFGGSTPSTKEPAFWDGEHAFATPKDLSQISTPILLDTARRVTDAGLAKIGRGLMPPDTVLMSSRAPVGYLAITRLPVTVNQGMAAMVCDRELRAPFVLNWTRANMDEVHSRSSGSTFAEISKSAFREIPCVVPPPHVHDAYHVSAATMYDLMTANASESRTLAELRDALLPRLISGELRVSEASQAVEAAV